MLVRQGFPNADQLPPGDPPGGSRPAGFGDRVYLPRRPKQRNCCRICGTVMADERMFCSYCRQYVNK